MKSSDNSAGKIEFEHEERIRVEQLEREERITVEQLEQEEKIRV